MPINSFLYPGVKVTPVFEVANSIRFDEASTTFLSKASFGTPTSTKKSTVSFWCKRSLVEEGIIFMNDSNTFPIAKIYFTSAHKFSYIEFDPSIYLERTTNALFRDVSAWSHFVVSVDMTQSSADDRVKIYHNGTQITSFSASTTPAQNTDVIINNNLRTGIGGTGSSGGDGFEGYVAELVRIDGQALTPTSFGEFDEDTGIWKPIDVSGLTFGTNGFYLDFENSAELGTDVSGASNTFTENNLTAEHQSTDTCTNNFATMNPLAIDVSKSYTFSEGNLNISLPENAPSLATIGVSSGKWYAEVKFINNTGWHGVAPIDSAISSNTGVIQWYQGNTLYVSGSNTATWGSALSNNDIMGIALDMDNSRVTISQNGNWWGGSSYNQSAPHTYYSLVSGYDDTITFYGNSGNGTSSVSFNFGSPSFSISSGNSDANGYGNFEYSVPSGYYALNTKNLAEYG